MTEITIAMGFIITPTGHLMRRVTSVHDLLEHHNSDFTDLLLFNTLSSFVIAFLPRSFPFITNTKVG